MSLEYLNHKVSKSDTYTTSFPTEFISFSSMFNIFTKNTYVKQQKITPKIQHNTDIILLHIQSNWKLIN